MAEQQQEDSSLSFIGALVTKVVGLRYYNGMLGRSEQVQLVPEPTNPYDRNAIKVGHLPKEVAAAFAALISQNMVILEGSCPFGRGESVYNTRLDLLVLGQETNTNAICQHLRRYGLVLLANPPVDFYPIFQEKSTSSRKRPKVPTKSLPPPPPPPTIEQELGLNRGEASNVSRLEIEKAMESFFKVHDLADLPVHQAPSPYLITPLLSYQLQGLAWMQQAENPTLQNLTKDEIKQFWQKQNDKKGEYFVNIATFTASREEPKLMRGGILADDMGLGKTLQAIALLLLDLEEAVEKVEEIGNGQFSLATLIVCPMSVIHHWEEQLKRHVAADKISWYIYHGVSRNRDAGFLTEHNVIITSYQTMAADWGDKYTGPLFRIKWRRVILDEGHLIKNPKARMSKAATELVAQRRWILTGTPITNEVILFDKLIPYFMGKVE